MKKHEDEEEVEEEVQITEEELVDILEELTLDMEPTKAGWNLQRPDSSIEHEIDILQTKVEEPLDVKELEEEEKEDEDLSEALNAIRGR
jgi:phenylalanyl-tRNA synthetase beta subunit